ncbi:MAG TPA: VIT1/CCC1 transporter family protein [Actinomycetota bacterium]|nr:VIT1/CCC1 transporter family protein [Actinomycetota bacterium]
MSQSFLGRIMEAGRSPRMHPHVGPTDNADVERIAGTRSGALRAAIFGANDGLVSNLSLIMGVAGANIGRTAILVAGVAGLIAGAFSMGAGEYVSMRVQRELFERLLHIEAHELATQPVEERRELARLYRLKGMPKEVAEQAADALMRDPQVALETHAREELGLDPNALGSPIGAALSSFVMFAIGAIAPLVPFLVAEGTAAILASVTIGAVALFALGAGMARFTGRPVALSGGRMLLIGGTAAAVTYGVGSLLNVGGIT